MIRHFIYASLVILIALVGLSAEQALASGETRIQAQGFIPSVTSEGVLAAGALGLPGEPITWVVTVRNTGDSAGSQVVITDVVPAQLRIDSVEVDRGSFSISGQTVTLEIAALNAGDVVQMRINTTVVGAPPNGILLNQVALAGQGPAGTVTAQTTSQLDVPISLPATGYKPEDLPGEGEPSVYVVALTAAGIVLLAACFVWWRGRDTRVLRRL